MIDRFIDFLIARRLWVVLIIAAITALMSWSASRIDVRTVFEDLLPQDHAYVAVHEEFKETFGSSNMVSIMLTVDDGEIFERPVLEQIRGITRELRAVTGVNSFQIISLASNHMKEVRATTAGIDTSPLMWPDLPETDQGIVELRDKVLGNNLVYGSYVSMDLKSALITVDFYDHLVDYTKIFNEIHEITDAARDAGLEVSIVGDPILYGWVDHYLDETYLIAGVVILVLFALLLLITRTWRGTFLPMIAGGISALWALGVAAQIGLHFEPLVVVVALLLFARAISHSVQLITRFEDENASGAKDSSEASHKTLKGLFRPGMLGLATDIGCVSVVALTPIPLLEKLVIIGVVWLSTIIVSALIVTPVLLSWCRDPHARVHGIDLDRPAHRVLDGAYRVVTTRGRYWLVGGISVIFLASGWYATNLQIGDANPGSPILWPDSEYNLNAARINETFPGSDRMFVVVSGEEDALKEPEVLEHMQDFQRFMEVQPQVGASMAITDLVPIVKRSLFEGNPRYYELGESAMMNGELMYLYQADAAPGDMERFVDGDYKNGAVTLFFRDRQGDTIRTAVSRINEFLDTNPIETVEYRLAGGVVGVLAAVNEVILAGQIQSIALALLVLVILCTVVYRSSMAGLFFMVPVVLANTLTFSFMAWRDIGMNINTVPVAALGIGLGVDYALYVVDRIKEELGRGNDLLDAIKRSVHTAGKGVMITATTLIVAVLLWSFSSLKFQAEMGMLLALWLFVSAVTAIFVMPSLVYIFRPKFVLQSKTDSAGQRGSSGAAAADAV